jgi:hypothetical protein
MTLRVSDLTMVSLGKTDRAGYTIRLDMHRLNWSSGTNAFVGMFFGCHDAVKDGKPYKKFQYLEIFVHDKGQLSMSRRWGTFYPDEAPLRLPSTEPTGPGASEMVQRPAVRTWASLEIRVVKGIGLDAVIWNNLPVFNLVQPNINAAFEESDYIGEFGTWTQNTECRYGRSEISFFGKMLN